MEESRRDLPERTLDVARRVVRLCQVPLLRTRSSE
jgi:hypothetical protein